MACKKRTVRMDGGAAAGRRIVGQTLEIARRPHRNAEISVGWGTGSPNSSEAERRIIRPEAETRPKRERHATICSDLFYQHPGLLCGRLFRRFPVPRQQLLSLLLIHPLLRTLRLPLCQPGTVLLSDMRAGREVRAESGLRRSGAEGQDHGSQSCRVGDDDADDRRILRSVGGGRSGTAAPPPVAGEPLIEGSRRLVGDHHVVDVGIAG